MADNEGRQIIRERIRNCILNILRQVQVVHACGDEGEWLGNIHFRLEWLLSIVTRYYQTNVIEREILNLLRKALTCLTEVCDPEYNNVAAETIFTGTRGRPSYNVPREQLDFLVERQFSVRQMASILGVSESTAQRRL